MTIIDLLVDLQYGSCGKGKFAHELAQRVKYSAVSSANMPNAGHTVVDGGERLVYKVLPSASKQATNLICPTSVFRPQRLLEESTWTKQQIVLHENARTVVDGDPSLEAERGLAEISSTLQGCAPSMVRRIYRDGIGRVGTNPGVFSSFPDHRNIQMVDSPQWVDLIHSQDRILHEVSQGTMLSVDWGYFPHTTSRNCTAMSGLDALGANWSMVGDCYGLLRAHPIRVGGPSGPMPSELTWERLGERAGMSSSEIADIKQREHTTVTKKQRRISDLSLDELIFACRLNGCTKLIVNFVQYVDWAANGATREDELGGKISDFVRVIECATSVPVVAVGTSETTTIWLK